MTTITAKFLSSQTNVGFQFYDAAGALIGVRITAGISSGPSIAQYIATETIPADAIGVYWSGDAGEAFEDLRDTIASEKVKSAVYDSATAVGSVITLSDGTTMTVNDAGRATVE